MNNNTIFYTGGCRSGKSAAAQRWAEAQADNRVFVATAEARDLETAKRIALHQSTRGTGWVTLELPCINALHLEDYLTQAAKLGQVVLLDCLSLWTAACMEHTSDDSAILHALEKALQSVCTFAVPVAFVSNETGLGLVPMGAESRRFVDLLGRVNQKTAAFCDTAVFMVSGLPLALKGKI